MLSDLLETHFLVQGNARWVGQGRSADQAVNPTGPNLADDGPVEVRADPAAGSPPPGNAYIRFVVSHPEHFQVMFDPRFRPRASSAD